jgi:hypothetical protein
LSYYIYWEAIMNKPIGYWPTTLDRLIDEYFDRALADQGVQRRHWQILNILQASPAPTPRSPRRSARSGPRVPSRPASSWTT